MKLKILKTLLKKSHASQILTKEHQILVLSQFNYLITNTVNCKTKNLKELSSITGYVSLFQRRFFIYFFSCLDILIQQSQVVPGQNTSLWHNNKPLCLGRMITTCQKVILRELCMDKQRRLDEGISFKNFDPK